jgi:hypothetical protein
VLLTSNPQNGDVIVLEANNGGGTTVTFKDRGANGTIDSPLLVSIKFV